MNKHKKKFIKIILFSLKIYFYIFVIFLKTQNYFFNYF